MDTVKRSRKPNKYRNKKITIDGIEFDSKAEAAYYNRLKILKKAGEIKDFEMQKEFTLLEGFNHPSKKNKRGKPSRVRAIKYIPDFIVTENDGTKKVIDVKGMQTPDFKIKAKMFMKEYNMPLILAKRQGRGFKHVDV